ncbi:MAG: metalloregulator ArsR/SmtB family transcription factor [Zavarzinella sp.]
MKKMTQEQYSHLARWFQVLADPTRLAIMYALQKESKRVNDLVELLGAKQANVSKQLGILHSAALVSRQRDGTTVHYSIADPIVFEICDLVSSKLQNDLRDQMAMFGEEQ